MHKMVISYLVKSVQSREENEMLIFVENVMTNARLISLQRFQERRMIFLLLFMREKPNQKIIPKYSNYLSCG